MDNEDKQEEWIMKLHKLHFRPWLKKESIEDDGSIEVEMQKMLARGQLLKLRRGKGTTSMGGYFTPNGRT